MRGSVKTASAVLTESTYLYHFFLPERLSCRGRQDWPTTE